MHYKFIPAVWGPVVNIPYAIKAKLPKINGEFIKIYLYIIAGDTPDVESEDIAKALDLSDSLVKDAIYLLKNEGLLCEMTEIPKPNNQNDTSSELVEQEKPVKKPKLSLSREEITESVKKDPNLKAVVDEYEKIKAEYPNDTVIMDLYNLLYYYEWPPESISLVMGYVRDIDMHKFSMRYISSIIKEWDKDGIKEFSDVEQKIIQESQRYDYRYKALKAAGQIVKGKIPANILKILDFWKENGITIEMIEVAREKAIENTGSAPIKYINSIIKSWVGKKIYTRQEIEEDDRKHAEESQKTAETANAYSFKGRGKPPKQQNQNTSYDLDEWERRVNSMDFLKMAEELDKKREEST